MLLRPRGCNLARCVINTLWDLALVYDPNHSLSAYDGFRVGDYSLPTLMDGMLNIDLGLQSSSVPVEYRDGIWTDPVSVSSCWRLG